MQSFDCPDSASCSPKFKRYSSENQQRPKRKLLNDFNDMESKIETKQYSIFYHQVGGHTPFLTVGENKIQKLASTKEVQFYEFIQKSCHQMLKWTPQFYGYNEVHTEALLSALRLELGDRNGSANDAVHHSIIKFINKANLTDSKIILVTIEDLTAKFGRPCVIDIKMGTRQHGIDASDEKALSQTAKCKLTTSSSLGFRINGMQVWNNQADEYKTYSKYWGRDITDENMGPALSHYFFNGTEFRTQIVLKFISKLEQLQEDISEVQCQLYSSSLLLVYDGSNSSTADVEVRIIDFAHSELKSDFLSEEWSQIAPDCGFHFGVENLLRHLKEMLHLH